MIDWTTQPITEAQAKSLVHADATLPAINLWYGAVSAGKTVGSLYRFLYDVANAPTRGEIAMIGRTRDTLFRNVISLLQDPSYFGACAAQVEYNRGAPTATIFGRTVHIIGASDVRAERTIRGMTLCLSYVDEATLLNEEFWNMLMSRHRVKGAKVLATTNPDTPRHFLKREWIDRAAEFNHRIFHFRLRDNAQNLEDAYIDGLERQFTGLWHKRFVEGEWSVAEGAIYAMFDPALHVVAELPEMKRLLACGIDFGVQHATRGMLLALGVDDKLYIVAEWTPPTGTEAERATSLTRFYQEHGVPEYTFVDPGGGGAGFILQAHQSGIPNVFNAMKDVVDGIGLVASLLSAGRLLIHESCKELIDEIPAYVWDAKAAEKGEDAPVKANDDNVDAWRYAIFSSRMIWQPYIDLYAATRQPDPKLEVTDAIA